MSPFLAGFTWLLLFQCAGEAIAHVADIPIPGPVLGMALLLVVLLVRGSASEAMTNTADGLAKHLSLLFVPAGAGVMLHVTQIEAEWVPIVAAIVISTILALATAALTFQWIVRRQERP
jgi:holin-like protein